MATFWRSGIDKRAPPVPTWKLSPTISTSNRQVEITEVLEKGWIFREDDLPEPTPVAAPALELLGIDTDGRPDIAKRFTANDPITRIESIGIAEGAKHKITVILRNRTGRPALIERIEETIP